MFCHRHQSAESVEKLSCEVPKIGVLSPQNCEEQTGQSYLEPPNHVCRRMVKPFFLSFLKIPYLHIPKPQATGYDLFFRSTTRFYDFDSI
jgi:hypothetical protein